MESVLIMMQNTLAMHVGIPSSNFVFGANKDLGDTHMAIPVNVSMSTGHVTKFISDISKDDFNILFEHVPFDPALRDSGQPFTSQDTDEGTIITLTPNTPAPIASTRAVTFKATLMMKLSTFDDDAQNTYLEGVANALNVPKSVVSIGNIDEIDGVKIEVTTVAEASVDLADSVEANGGWESRDAWKTICG
jgi:hypothetical protein